MPPIGFLQPIRKEQKVNSAPEEQVAKIDFGVTPLEAPTNDKELLTVGEFRTLLYQLEARLKQHITIEISDELARIKPSLIRELVSELLGALDAREIFKEYEARRNNPQGEEDFFSEMRRMYSSRGN